MDISSINNLDNSNNEFGKPINTKQNKVKNINSIIEEACKDKILEVDEQAEIILANLKLNNKIEKKLDKLGTDAEFVMNNLYKSGLPGIVISKKFTIEDAKTYLQAKTKDFKDYLKNALNEYDIKSAQDE